MHVTPEHQARLEQCMLLHRHRLRSRANRMRHGHVRGDSPQRWLADLDHAVAYAGRRRAALPTPTYPPELPVVQRREEIAAAIAAHQVIVLCGETGSGKTTQLPKICLELGRGVAGLIGHTQPRRIAARSVATRLAHELHSPLGQAVGYQVRFIDQLSENTFVKLMTDGILLAEIPNDRLLLRYDTLIIDEAHERSLNIDFLLGYLRHLLPRRPDLKLIITSATIDPQRFSAHFGGAPVIEVSGRTYPVEVRYRPLKDASEEEDEIEIAEGIGHAIDELWGEGPGDILVFLPTERDIRTTAEQLRTQLPQNVQILPLFARLSSDEQMRVFQPHSQRRIVLATNVAETSLTVPGIRYVIDTGLARMSRYSPRSRVQRLPIEPISRASADQRKGRCGRLGPGICIRLYGEEDFAKRIEFTDPEILRTNLASVILQMKAMRLGDIEHFSFIDPPDRRAIRDGYDALQELGALDSGNNLTPIGAALAKLPIDPRLGRMILQSIREGCLDDVLIITAALSVQDPRERPIEKASEADAAHARWKDESSDFVTLLNLWTWYHEQAGAMSQNRLRKACQESFLSYLRMREWVEVHAQLRILVRQTQLQRAGAHLPAVDTSAYDLSSPGELIEAESSGE